MSSLFYAAVRTPKLTVTAQKLGRGPAPKGDSPTPGGRTDGSASLSEERYIPEDYKARMESLAGRIKLSDSFAVEGASDEGLLAFILAGIFWGGVSLITPCVFPKAAHVLSTSGVTISR